MLGIHYDQFVIINTFNFIIQLIITMGDKGDTSVILAIE